MNRGFYTILAAQFFSALADNALLFAAIALLANLEAPPWQTPVLQQFFVFSYIVLAPFVGPFADALPKGRVMFVANAVKLTGCAMMLFDLHPLLAYGVVGIGAAMYSPAKYGILTEYLPHHQLVLANGWMEGLTVAAIILGAVLGGFMLAPHFYLMVLGAGGSASPLLESPAKLAILTILGLYLTAAAINLYIPRVAIDHKLPKRTPLFILQDFWHSFRLLWRDPLGQVSLAVTTLFWGAGATLRLIVLSWAALALNFDLERATQLTAVVAVGIALGSVLAARYVPLTGAVRVLPVGIAMGLAVIAMVFIDDWRLAVAMLILIGAMGGYFVVPMNALLQHRGHLLMGAGHSIAVQNFNENLSILAMLGAYALMLRADLTIRTIIVLFGLLVAGAMYIIYLKHRQDQVI
ncbi:MAG TPA: lysophospholipid transporter LplT [Burkholderiales bacterium]|jgi:LPLT family lysophospholipid transporter-like MFS transporter|nr:lysophospholipid transporter LplT [Burkholderiales bacterium]